MKILIASDKFKGSLSATQVCDAIVNGMKINNDNNDTFEYEYILNTGISEVKGGVKVLKDLGYPIDMINITGEYLSKV